MTDPEVPSETPEIPDKLYFRIGEVAGLLAVEPYVLRYWETEFPRLAPKKSGTGHRLYRRKDVELLLKIKHLLYEKRYTIEGARQSLLNDSKVSRPQMLEHKQGDLFRPDPLTRIRTELASILKILK
ncbi:MAG TPA: MerR family transcriptional regulator [Bryobacteraceae bacterium]|jgi:DNA-binding transcriptional MerR regulator|nr:MerR family transcriptional regulator [Bryobacteraceae bacterium]